MLSDEVLNRLQALTLALEAKRKEIFKKHMECESQQREVEREAINVELNLLNGLGEKKTNAEQRKAMVKQQLTKDEAYQNAFKLGDGFKAELKMLEIEAEKIENERSDLKAYVRMLTFRDDF
jgi:hypothetical protein